MPSLQLSAGQPELERGAFGVEEAWSPLIVAIEARFFRGVSSRGVALLPRHVGSIA
jgi:hypothetical protein